MSVELTQEQIAQVARECANNIYYWENPADWTPSFDSDDPEDRSEALAIVEWLAEKIEELHFVGAKISQMKMYELFSDVMLAVKRKDTTALMALVLELQK